MFCDGGDVMWATQPLSIDWTMFAFGLFQDGPYQYFFGPIMIFLTNFPLVIVIGPSVAVLGTCVGKLSVHANCSSNDRVIKIARWCGFASIFIHAAVPAFVILGGIFVVFFRVDGLGIADLISISAGILGVGLALILIGLAHTFKITDKSIRKSPRNLYMAATVLTSATILFLLGYPFI